MRFGSIPPAPRAGRSVAAVWYCVTVSSLLYLAAGTLVAALAATGWAALALAHGGRFDSSLAMVAGVAAGSAVAIALRRSLRPSSAWRTDLAAIGAAALGAAALAPAGAPWPAYFDGGWYLNAAAAIARAGSLAFRPEPLAIPELRPLVVSTFADHRIAVPRAPDREDRGFFDVAFAVGEPGAAIAQPFHPPLAAATLAVAMRGLRDQAPQAPAPPDGGAGRVVLIWALAYLLAAAAVARALFGPLAALLTVTVLAACPAFVYYGAHPFAEVPAGALALAGAACLAVLAGRERPAPALAAAAGLGLGLATLAKVELALPAAVAAVWWLVARWSRGGWSEGLALAAGALLPLTHLGLLARGATATYFDLNSAGVLEIARGALLRLDGRRILTVAALGGLLLGALARRLGRAGAAAAGRRVARWTPAAAVVAALATGTLVVMAPVDTGSTPPIPALLFWLLTPLGAWAAGAVAVAAVRPRPATPPAPMVRARPIVALALVTGVLFAAAPVVTTGVSPLYTLRRFVPVVLPLTLALASGAAVAPLGAADIGFRRRPAVLFLAGAGMTLVVAAQLAAGAALRTFREFDGSVGLLSRLAREIEPGSLVLFPSPLAGSEVGRLAAPLWTVFGVPTAVLARPDVDAGQLAGALRTWRLRRGTGVYFVADDLGPVPVLAGWDADLVTDTQWVAPVLAPRPDMPPRPGREDLSYQVLKLTPSGAATGVGARGAVGGNATTPRPL